MCFSKQQRKHTFSIPCGQRSIICNTFDNRNSEKKSWQLVWLSYHPTPADSVWSYTNTSVRCGYKKKKKKKESLLYLKVNPIHPLLEYFFLWTFPPLHQPRNFPAFSKVVVQQSTNGLTGWSPFQSMSTLDRPPSPGSQCIYHLSAQHGSFLLHKYPSSCKLAEIVLCSTHYSPLVLLCCGPSKGGNNIKGLKAVCE